MKFEKNGHQLGKAEVVFIILVIISITAVVFYAYSTNKSKQSSIDSFESCVASGNPVNESYPETCNANGKVFTNPSHNNSNSE